MFASLCARATAPAERRRSQSQDKPGMRKVLDRPLPRGKQEVRAPASPGLVRSQAQKVAAAASRTSAEALRLRAPPAEAVRASQMRRQPRCVAALKDRRVACCGTAAWPAELSPCAQVGLSAFAFLFSEFIQYSQARVNTADQLQQK